MSPTMEWRLPTGHVVLIEQADYERLKRRSWRYVPTGYVTTTTRVKGKQCTLLLHREILGNVPPGMEVDHADGNPLNNVRSNLRICTCSQNHANLPKLRRGPSGYRGVYRKPDCVARPWGARLTHKRKEKFLGLYATPEEAARVYDAEALLVYGEFATLNFPLVLRHDR